jgi:hypothetical protein
LDVHGKKCRQPSSNCHRDPTWAIALNDYHFITIRIVALASCDWPLPCCLTGPRRRPFGDSCLVDVKTKSFPGRAYAFVAELQEENSATSAYGGSGISHLKFTEATIEAARIMGVFALYFVRRCLACYVIEKPVSLLRYGQLMLTRCVTRNLTTYNSRSSTAALYPSELRCTFWACSEFAIAHIVFTSAINCSALGVFGAFG